MVATELADRRPNHSPACWKKSPRPMPLDNTNVTMQRMARPANTTLLCLRKPWNGLKAIANPHLTTDGPAAAGSTGLDGLRSRIVWVDGRTSGPAERLYRFYGPQQPHVRAHPMMGGVARRPFALHP